MRIYDIFINTAPIEMGSTSFFSMSNCAIDIKDVAFRKHCYFVEIQRTYENIQDIESYPMPLDYLDILYTYGYV